MYNYVTLCEWDMNTSPLYKLGQGRVRMSGYTDLEVGSKVACDMRRVTLGEHSDLLLDVLNLIICFLQINDLDCHHLVAAVLHPE